MRRYLFYRILSVIITVLITSLFVFSMMEMTEGDVTSYLFGEEVSSDVIRDYRESFEEPFLYRYFLFLRSFLSLQWGRSANGRDIKALIFARLPVTIALTIYSLLLSILIVVPLSFLAALKKNSKSRSILSLISVIGYSLPSFLIAFSLVILFSVILKLFPIAGYSQLKYGIFAHFRSLFLPSATIAIVQSSLYSRMLLASLDENLNADYAISSKAWGLSNREVLFNEALKPSMTVMIALVFQSLASGIAGSAVIENVFALPGLGSLLVSAALSRDTMLLGISLLFLSVLISLLFIVSEIIQAFTDPRARRQHA